VGLSGGFIAAHHWYTMMRIQREAHTVSTRSAAPHSSLEICSPVLAEQADFAYGSFANVPDSVVMMRLARTQAAKVISDLAFGLILSLAVLCGKWMGFFSIPPSY
jgi:hypothetical protein